MKSPQLKTVIPLITSFVFVIAAPGLGKEPLEKTTPFFNAEWLETVVSIEVKKEGADDRPIGTGFLVKTDGMHVLLVTAKHVITDETGKTKPNLRYRLNAWSGGTVLFKR